MVSQTGLEPTTAAAPGLPATMESNRAAIDLAAGNLAATNQASSSQISTSQISTSPAEPSSSSSDPHNPQYKQYDSPYEQLSLFRTDGAPPNGDRPSSSTPAKPKRRKWFSMRWPFIWLTVLLGCGGSSLLGFLWLTRVPPVPDCRQINQFSADQERLYCAKVATRSGDVQSLLNGLQLIANWTKEHPLYNESRVDLKNWSTEVFAIARQRWTETGVAEAVELASQIPSSSPLYEQVQKQIDQWQRDWAYGQNLYQQAQLALKARQWRKAEQRAQSLAQMNTLPWQKLGLEGLPAQQRLEQQAAAQLVEAQAIARSNQPNDLARAIAIVRQINQNRYPYGEAQAEKAKWSAQLLQIAQTRLDRQDFEGAIVAAKQMPTDAKQLADARDLTHLAQARLSSLVANQPLPAQIWGLMEALAAARQIAPDRPLYTVMQTDVKRWREQLADLNQLQVAQTVAHLRHPLAIGWAIDKAEMVPAYRPENRQARSLIGQWRGDLQRLADQPYIWKAQQLAKQNTIANLRQAIATANKIRPGHVLRLEAQTLVAQWNRQVRVLEDQPILDAANALAQQQEYRAAIATASRIGSDRPLYNEAQARIGSWNAQIAMVADRAILNRAAGLASEVRLTAAIDLASQISPGSPLYGEAQAAIRQWVRDREEFWRNQEPELDPYAEDRNGNW